MCFSFLAFPCITAEPLKFGLRVERGKIQHQVYAALIHLKSHLVMLNECFT